MEDGDVFKKYNRLSSNSIFRPFFAQELARFFAIYCLIHELSLLMLG